MRRLLFYTYSVLWLTCHSQRSSVLAGLDSLYTPNHSSIFNTSGSKRGFSRYGSTHQFIVGFCPTMFFRRKILLEFDKRITPRFYITAFVGTSFGADLLMERSFSIFTYEAFSYTKVPASTIFGNAKFNSGTPILGGALKIFLHKTGSESAKKGNTFMEISYRHDKVNYLLNPLVDGRAVEGDSLAVFNTHFFSLGIAYMAYSGKKSNLVHQFFAKATITAHTYTNFDIQARFYIKNTRTEVLKVDSEKPYKLFIFPGINIGYCLGFGF